MALYTNQGVKKISRCVSTITWSLSKVNMNIHYYSYVCAQARVHCMQRCGNTCACLQCPREAYQWVLTLRIDASVHRWPACTQDDGVTKRITQFLTCLHRCQPNSHVTSFDNLYRLYHTSKFPLTLFVVPNPPITFNDADRVSGEQRR